LQINHSNTFTIKPVSECGELIYKTNNGGSYRRLDPEILGPRAHWVQALQQKEIGRLVEPPQAEVYRLKDVTIWTEGIVTTSENCVIEESLINAGPANTMKDFKRAEDTGSLSLLPSKFEVIDMSDHTYVHVGQPWDLNYGHWLMDCLPRVILSHQAIAPAEVYYILNHAGPIMRRVTLDSLAPFGITKDRLYLRVSNPIRVKDLIYAKPMTIQPWVAAPFTVRTLSGLGFMLAHDKPNPRPSLIYVRRQGTRRNLANQDELSAIAAERGYIVVNPASHTLAEQATMFSNARVIVGPLGAELVNTVFAPPNVTLITMSSSLAKDGFYWNLVSLVGGSYIGLHGDYIGKPSMDPDYEIDTELFSSVLDRVGHP
jgi:hypothetical protein